MLLAEELFQEIAGLCIVDLRNDGSERREHPRVELGRRGTVMHLFDTRLGPPHVVIIRDMSVKGVALLQGESVEIGDEFVLDVTKFVGRALGIQCHVERVEPGGSGGTQFVVGATFVCLIETEVELMPTYHPVEEPLAAAGRWRTLLQRLAKLRPTFNWARWLKVSREKTTVLAKRLMTR